MLTLYRNVLLPAITIAMVSCLPVVAQEIPAPTPTSNPGSAVNETPLLDSQAVDDALTFEQVLEQYNENEIVITRLFSSSPIGFPKRQIEHMAKIDRLKEKNRQLKNQLDEAALLSFQQSVNPSPPVCRTVFNIISKKIDLSRGGSNFDPEKASEVFRNSLKTKKNGRHLT